MGLFGPKTVRPETGAIPDGVIPELVEINGNTYLEWGRWPFKRRMFLSGNAGPELQHMAEEGEYVND